MNKQKMMEEVELLLCLKEKGHVTAIEVFPGGTKDGLDFGPMVVEIVVLDRDGNTVAYRMSTDSHDDDWQIGGIEDAVDEAIGYKEQAKDTELLLQELGYA